MPRANRNNKGNRKRAVFDRLLVPENGFQLPPQIRQVEPDLPLTPVGQRVWIENVIIHEISISYEGKPQRFIKKIPFSLIVGDPVSDEKLDSGYEYTTPQGETLLVKWHVATNRENQGLIIHNKRVTGTSYFEPNWGQVYGVGLEWIACDGSGGGTIWANRHLGHTTEQDNGAFNVQTYASTVEPEYSPNAVRGGLMLGNPEPYRTIWLMGQDLPMRVYPSLGAVKTGCVFGFNKNVMAFLTVKPPVPPVLAFTGAGTARGDAVGVRWQKDELHTGYTRVAMQVLDGASLVKNTVPSYPLDGSVSFISDPVTAMSGSGKISTINFNDGGGQFRVRLMLVECDASGTPQSILNCTENVWDWVSGSSSCSYTQEECGESLPYPEKVETGCGRGSGNPTDPTNPTNPTNPTTGLTYFCDNSVQASSIDTSYWVGDRALSAGVAAAVQSQYGITVDTKYWQGRNSYLDLFQKMDGGTPYSRSKITPTNFHSYLYKMLTDNLNGNGTVIDSADWQAFKTWCTVNGLTCLTDLQKASLYSTYKLGVPVNFFASAAGYLEGSILDILLANLSLLPRGIYDWIDFNDIIADSGNSITGAFAADIPSLDFKAFRSFVNFEPQALQYGIASAKAHRPTDYVKLPGSQWGTTTAVDWSSYNMQNMTNTNYIPYVAAEVGIHEIGHSIAYYGLDYYGTALHDMPEWLAISGWSSGAPSQSPSNVSAHLAKSRSASQTGGMPKTDAGKEAPVSDYGCFHPAEDFAEAYRLYVLNPTFLEDKYPQKYAFMVNKVEPMFS